ncbi:MAG TPA: serpin family protein [Lacipirellulaceae bacterium]|nr:serpin family protein [Lacipirellulaceae bacterium]
MCRLQKLIAVSALACSFLLSAVGVCQTHERASLTPDQRTAVAGQNAFAIDLFHQLRANKSGENLLVSPFSISTALAMTYAGARNDTAAQMADMLHFGLPDDQLHSALGSLIGDLNVSRTGYEMAIANRLFGQHDTPFKQPFLDVNAQSYGAPLESMDFVANSAAARIHINDWVAEQTNDRIKDLLPPGSVNELTRLVLTNAVYFDGKWKYQFDPDNTRDAAFHISQTQQVQAPTMYQKAEFRHGSFDSFQMLEMPYSGDDLSMVIMLPHQSDGLAQLESQLTTDLFQQCVESLQKEEVDVHLPKFTFTDDFDLAGTLQDMGMTDAFDPGRANFDGIADRSVYDMHIAGVFHKTFIDVNEVGTEAAAATGVIIGITSVPPPPPVFRADHPFLFALRDVHSGSLLFLGRLNEPEHLAASANPPTFNGDYNGDGVVDGADYVVWRKNDGTPAGYDAWRANFGRTMGSAALSNAAVPEPSGANLLMAAFLVVTALTRTHVAAFLGARSRRL